MKCSLVTILLLAIYPYFTNAIWCVQQTTFNTIVTKELTKMQTYKKWIFGRKRAKAVRYTVSELVPRVIQHRVCCQGYTLVGSTCEPNCPAGCPQFSKCVKPNTCECQIGYQRKGASCEPICKSACPDNAFCWKPSVCLCKSGFKYNYSTRSCDSGRRTVRVDHWDSTAEPTTYSTMTQKRKTTTQTPKTETATSNSIDSFTSAMTPLKETTRLSFIASSSAPITSPNATTTEEITSKMSKLKTAVDKSPSSGYRKGNAYCSPTYNCVDRVCTLASENCQCDEGFIKADTYCQFDFESSGFKFGECIRKRLCRVHTTQEYTSSTHRTSSSESSVKRSVFTSTEISSNCELGCSGGVCVNGLCQCPKGSVFSQVSNSCVIKSSCDKNCHDGTVRVDHLDSTAEPTTYSTITQKRKTTTQTPKTETATSNTIDSFTSVKPPLKATTRLSLIASSTAPRTSSNATTTEEITSKMSKLKMAVDTSSTHRTSSSEKSVKSSTFTSTEISSNCELGCSGGVCVNGLCQCPKGSVFSQASNSCLIKSSCDKNCHDGICQENGVCKCVQGFVYQYNNGCVRDCDQKCINGICAAAGKCKCLNGFIHKPENLFECIPAGEISEKVERHDDFDFPWIWVVSTVLIVAIIGLFLFKKSRNRFYKIDVIENSSHIVQFDNKCALVNHD